MINFSLNTCWRLIPTNGRMEVADFQLLPFSLITFLITFCLASVVHATKFQFSRNPKSTKEMF